MENEKIKQAVRKIFTEYLESNKHRKTPERFAILETIYSINGHFDIEKLYVFMAEQEKFRVSRATLYNTIILLMDAKLVIKHLFGSSSQYEKCFNIETHHHLICTQCSKVVELHDENLQKQIENSKMGRFYMSHYSLYIYGTCCRCARANKKKRTNNKNSQNER